MRFWSHALAWLLCLATVVLLAAGALVTSTGSSLAVPDWPLAYGQLFPPMVGGILYEHGHRLIASTVGLITIAIALWLWRCEPRAWVRWLGAGALGLIVVQGVLGGITVLYLLPKAVSIGHALSAQSFFLLTVFMVQVTSPDWEMKMSRANENPQGGRTTFLAAGSFALLFLVLILGAVMRHFDAGLAIPDFPLAFGRLVPPTMTFPVAIHYFHRVGAFAALILIAVVLWDVLSRHGQSPQLKRPALTMGVLVVVQIGLGGASILWERLPILTALHLVNGAVLLAASGLLTLRAWMLAPRVRGAEYIPSLRFPAS
jgi:cytochrome c oxidase assembly protein subunit 15